MNWRLKLLSVLILGLFAAFAYYYYQYFISPKPSGIVLFIVPGLNLDNIAQTNDNNLNLLNHSTRFAVLNNDDLAPFQTHTNAIFSYIATGYKTHPDRIGISSDGRVQNNLLYIAQRARRNVGLVSTHNITTIELAAFYSHSKNPENKTDLLQQLFDNTKINLILGGGGEDFTTVKQTTNRDLFHEAELNGYKIAHTNDELQDLPAWRPPWQANRTLGIFAKQNLPPYNPLADESGHNPYPSLPDLTRSAIQLLDMNLNRYFLIIHDGLIADAIRANNPQQITNEIRQLDNALAEARNQAGKNSVIILYSPYNISPANGQPADNSFGWLAIYSDNDDPIHGFATGKDFFRYIRKQL